MVNVKIADLYDLSHTQANGYLSKYTYPWEALANIKDLILEIGASLDPELYEKRGEDIWISKSAKIYPVCAVENLNFATFELHLYCDV